MFCISNKSLASIFYWHVYHYSFNFLLHLLFWLKVLRSIWNLEMQIGPNCYFCMWHFSFSLHFCYIFIQNGPCPMQRFLSAKIAKLYTSSRLEMWSRARALASTKSPFSITKSCSFNYPCGEKAPSTFNLKETNINHFMLR